MTEDERSALLQDLAASIGRGPLAGPARIVLDIVAPLGVLAGQAAMFARPLLPHDRWRSYAAALEEEAAWHELRRLIDERP